MFPDESHDLIRSSLAAGECYERILAVATAGIGVRKAEFVRYGPTIEWCPEKQFTGRLTTRELLARQSAYSSSADDGEGIGIGGAGGRNVG